VEVHPAARKAISDGAPIVGPATIPENDERLEPYNPTVEVFEDEKAPARPG